MQTQRVPNEGAIVIARSGPPLGKYLRLGRSLRWARIVKEAIAGIGKEDQGVLVESSDGL